MFYEKMFPSYGYPEDGEGPLPPDEGGNEEDEEIEETPQETDDEEEDLEEDVNSYGIEEENE